MEISKITNINSYAAAPLLGLGSRERVLLISAAPAWSQAPAESGKLNQHFLSECINKYPMHRVKEGEVKMTQKNSASVMKN